MNSTNNINRDPSLDPTTGKETKRSVRAFGPVDMNSFQGSNVPPGVKPPFALPNSPNPTLKKKMKPAAGDSKGAGNQQPSQQPKVTPSRDDAILTAALDGMTIDGEAAAQTTTEIDWKPIQKELDALFVKQSKERMKGVPMIAMPKIFKQNGVTLFDHQKEG